MFAAEVVCSCLLTSHRQTSQPVNTDWKVSHKISTGAGDATAEEAWSQQFITRKLQTDFQPVNNLYSPGMTHVDTPASSPAKLGQL